ncbi:hypothetical protein WME89_39735 [Sorangium sp. So ce321]|uniref:hypothetical protein n=1 Tax=Sorangium sp. So ce321 TaxID=3133300 RepID=UPI003F61B803
MSACSSVVQIEISLADVLAAQGRHAEAETFAGKALEAAPLHASIAARGEALSSTGQHPHQWQLDGGLASQDGALALCRIAASRSALGRPDAREAAQWALDALRAEFEEQEPFRRETELHLLRILGLDA